MIDVTELVFSKEGIGQGAAEKMLKWCEDTVGPRLHQIDTGAIVGEGWKFCIVRQPGKRNERLTWCFDFDNELDELQFKIVWSALTSHLTIPTK